MFFRIKSNNSRLFLSKHSGKVVSIVDDLGVEPVVTRYDHDNVRLVSSHVKDDAHTVDMNRFMNVVFSVSFSSPALKVFILVDKFEMFSYLMIVRCDDSFFGCLFTL